MTNPTQQLDVARLTRYLEAHVPGFEGPVDMEKFAGGQSNPTFLLHAKIGRSVLPSRPPSEPHKSAHGVDRACRMLTGSAGTA
ncbi:phosphotransferase family protein, partial [Burkholderia contaminans]